jgi:hypothetical protein
MQPHAEADEDQAGEVALAAQLPPALAPMTDAAPPTHEVTLGMPSLF